MRELKFNDVMKRGRLDRSTAQYVAKSGKVAGTPKAGEKGRHRTFTLGQARDFALATRLVMSGVEVAVASQIVEFCRRRIDKLGAPSGGWKDDTRFNGGAWTLEIYDDNLVRLWRNDKEFAEHHDADEHFSLSERKMVKDFDYPKPISKHEIDLTLLEKELRKEV